MRETGAVKRTTAKPRTPKSRFETPSAQAVYTPEELAQKIQETAYHLYQERGSAHGFDVEDWLAAEQIVKGE